MSRSSSSDDPDRDSRKGPSLSLVDKLWIGIVVAVFVIAFAVILIYGVF